MPKLGLKRKTVINGPKDKELEESIDRYNRTCPTCKYDGIENGICLSTTEWTGLFGLKQINYTVYTCNKCGTRWKIEED